MPTYRYQAANQQGRVVRGSLLAATRDGALARLRELGYLPVALHEVEFGAGAGAGVSTGASRAGWLGGRSGAGRGIGPKEIAGFTRELADLLGAGLDLDRALGVLSDAGVSEAQRRSASGGRLERAGFRELVLEIRAEVQSGRSFGEVLQGYPRLFPAAYVGLVRSGETAGNLDIVLARLAELLQSEEEIKGFVRRSLVYPAIVAVTSFLAIVVMMTFVIPRFSRIFKYLGRKLPWPTQLLVNLSRFITAYGWILVVALVAGALLLRAYFNTEPGRRLLQRLAWEGPVIGGFYRRLTVSRLARTLGALLANGVTLSDALTVVTRAESNAIVKDQLVRVSQDVAAGAPVSRPLGATGLFPGRAVQVLRVGEETGGLDAMFNRVAGTFESETKREMETLLSLLEPVLILTMACGVAFVVLAMLLPVLSLNNLAM